jgi:hypothetical protein
LLAVNAYKFGSPFDNGYTQWARQTRLFDGRLLEGVTGFLFDGQKSVFINFPILIFALPGVPWFFKKHRKDLLFFLALGGASLVMHSKFLEWGGAWCYGPRYLLPVLPLLSLPLVGTLQAMRSHAARPACWIASLFMGGILFYSLIWQCRVNALPFCVVFQVEGEFRAFGRLRPEDEKLLSDYFEHEPFGVVCGDLGAYKKGKSYPVFVSVMAKLTPEIRTALLHRIGSRLSGNNYYWWP